MHYYKRNIGNYRRRTQHLTLLEHGIYNQMIDQYYLDEGPLPSDEKKLFRLLQIRTKNEKEAARNVIADFFIKSSDFLTHEDCQENVNSYKAMCLKNKENAKATRKPVASDSKAKGKPKESDPGLTINHKPRTKNQEPKYTLRDFKKSLSEMGVEDKFIDEWVEIRKKKKAVNSEMALKNIIAEINKTNLTINQGIEVCCKEGWKGFKASWLANLPIEKHDLSGKNYGEERDL